MQVPECVCGQVALPAPGGFQFDKRASRGIKGTHEGEAHAEDHQPVAGYDSWGEERQTHTDILTIRGNNKPRWGKLLFPPR